uniref:40-kDa huntingtin-associated protein n=1 Tax=Pristiophorus japonicus TaxID=55135 RepID=UPI00398F75DB
MAAEGDFLLRYRAVSHKLKRRFLRKPNVAEASEQFGQLAKELKQEECLQYAGFCNLAMARCEQTLFNAPGEALALTDAARLFLQAEKETQKLQCPGFEEHLQAATNCYSFAIKVYIELNQPVMAASLCLELGNALKVSTPVTSPNYTQIFPHLPLNTAPLTVRHSFMNYLPENIFLLLQSVVMACQEKDLESLKVLQVELWPLLTPEQNHLLHLVLQEVMAPSGRGV